MTLALRVERAVVVGASGGIGTALAKALLDDGAAVHALSRRGLAADARLNPARIDIEVEASIADAASALRAEAPLDLVVVASGLLHSDRIAPEKSYRQLSGASFERYFAVNATGPALVAKHFLPLLRKDRPAVLAVLSARVGSIVDNRLGGWYGYRASKAALNMIVKTLAIELARTHPKAACVALHPGTVETNLSQPFRRGVPGEKLFFRRHRGEAPAERDRWRERVGERRHLRLGRGSDNAIDAGIRTRASALGHDLLFSFAPIFAVRRSTIPFPKADVRLQDCVSYLSAQSRDHLSKSSGAR